MDECEVATLPNPSAYYYGKMRFEAKVAEAIVDDMVAAEEGIEIWKNCFPVAVERSGRALGSVFQEAMEGRHRVRVRAKAFVDASYEGDLMAVAGAPYRIGRESRTEFNEIHAGRIFTALHFADDDAVGYPCEAVEGNILSDRK